MRSTIRVDEQLLAGSRVRFVATATIGIDHLDAAWLDGAGIRWTSAPGSNADSVVQWFAAAMKRVPDVAERQLGIVGVGNVGGRIERLVPCARREPPLLCDPPRARREGSAAFVSLDEILARCDLVTLHVPLTRSGEDATVHLVDARKLRKDAVLVNACRGEVLDSARARSPSTTCCSSTCSKASRRPIRGWSRARRSRRRTSPATRSTAKPTAPR